jgi:hypothetical protein
VARQLNDPRLFERAERALSPDLGTAACVHIAEAWFAAGEPATALAWLERVRNDAFLARERERLLFGVYEALGDRGRLEELAWKGFRASPHPSTLDRLLGVIGAERREEVVAGAVETILGSRPFSPGHAEFLLECGRFEEAARYIVDRRDQVDGDHWSQLLHLIEKLESVEQLLAETVLYRALLDSILARGRSPSYHHGARYFGRLARMALRISDWGEVLPHVEYVAALRERHGLKRSFWRRV